MQKNEDFEPNTLTCIERRRAYQSYTHILIVEWTTKIKKKIHSQTMPISLGTDDQEKKKRTHQTNPEIVESLDFQRFSQSLSGTRGGTAARAITSAIRQACRAHVRAAHAR